MPGIQIYNHKKIARYFYIFLITNRVLDKFFQNFDKFGYQKYLSKTDEQYFLSHAFLWDETKEGFDYWHGLNDKWLRLLKKNKVKKNGRFRH